MLLNQSFLLAMFVFSGLILLVMVISSKAALLFWFFGAFRCVIISLRFVILVRYKSRKQVKIDA